MNNYNHCIGLGVMTDYPEEWYSLYMASVLCGRYVPVFSSHVHCSTWNASCLVGVLAVPFTPAGTVRIARNYLATISVMHVCVHLDLLKG